jgi:hypothetical protein
VPRARKISSSRVPTDWIWRVTSRNPTTFESASYRRGSSAQPSIFFCPTFRSPARLHQGSTWPVPWLALHAAVLHQLQNQSGVLEQPASKPVRCSRAAIRRMPAGPSGLLRAHPTRSLAPQGTGFTCGQVSLRSVHGRSPRIDCNGPNGLYQIGFQRGDLSSRMRATRIRSSHPVIVWSAAAFWWHPSDDLVRILDVARLAMHTV